MRIDTRLLATGPGPAALVTAKFAARRGIPCLLVGHEPAEDDETVTFSEAGVGELHSFGVLDVLRPYALALDPLTISARDFEEVVKQHCVADLNVTVYDGLTVTDLAAVDGRIAGTLVHGEIRWDVVADWHVDAASMPQTLDAAVLAAADVVRATLEGPTRG